MRAYEEIAPEPLAFPIGGKMYVVDPPGYLTGMKLQQLVAGQLDVEREFADDPEGLWRLILGKTFEAMKADNVPGEALARAAFTALTDYKFGRVAAEKVWETGVDPKALAVKMQEMAAQQPSSTAPAKAKGSTRSRSTASASRTRKPASTTPTTSRKR